MFETLRVGFPTYNVIVVDNGSHPDVVPHIETAAKQVGAAFSAVERHSFIKHYHWMLCEQDALDSVILLDPDVVFWENVENWKFDKVIAGRLIPDLTTGGVTSLSRLHPSHVWIPSLKRLRALGISVELKQEGDKFWDTLATIYQEHPDECQPFTEQQLDCYDHLFYGSHFPAIEPRLQDDNLTYESHRRAAAGDIESLRGIWREQEKYFQAQTNTPFVLTQEEVVDRMRGVCGALGQVQNVDASNVVEGLIANIKAQLPAATKEFLSLPQADCPVVHHFGPGICVRELSMPAGVLAIGHKQKFEHLNILLKGSVMVINDDGATQVLTAPLMFVGKPGQKVGYVLEDVVWQNIYSTELKDIDAIEAHFIEKSEEWQQHKLIEFAETALLRENDRLDYKQVLIESGFSHEVAVAQSENMDDQIHIDSAVTRVSNSPIQGKGLFVTSPVKAGEIICPARIDGKRTQAGRYTNHSSRPNAKMVLRSNGDVDLVASIDFKGCEGGDIGEEATIDYRQALALSNVQELTCQH